MPRIKYDAVIEAVHYLADGKIEHVRVYERRGAIWSDRMMLSRAALVERLQKGKRIVTGQRQLYLGSQLLPGQSVHMLKNTVTTEAQASDHDLLSGVPVIEYSDEACWRIAMKIIDQTPFYTEKGEITLLDRAKALMQYGKAWGAEMEAQKSVLPVLDKVLDKHFTLLRNITPPGVDTPIPFILVGPTGVYVMYVTPLVGMFRAKGDQWGTISGNAFKPEKPNLLTRTENMARAIQVYLQRLGYTELTGVEAVLLCANPSVHVDSLRPVVRIVMRDALERFAISIMQARLVLTPEAANDVINLILNPPAVKEETAAPETAGTGVNANVPASAGLDPKGLEPSLLGVEDISQAAPPPALPRPRKGISKKQWLFLAGMLVLWCLIMAVFIFLVVKDLPL